MAIAAQFFYFKYMKDLIVQELLKTDHKDGDQLPSVRALMKSFAVSSSTIQSALKQLASESKISRIQGKGCFWGDKIQFNAVPTVHESVSTQIKNAFEHDIASGFFKIGDPLPLSKELTIRYNVSPNSLRKFLEELVARGTLKKVGRRFYFATKKIFTTQTSLSELIFVTRCNSWGGFSPESEREMDFLRLVYKTAGKNQYKLILLGYNDNQGKLVDRSGAVKQLSDFPNAIGILISTLLVQNWKVLLSHFTTVKIPVAVWWEHPKETLPKNYTNKNNWIFFNSTFGSAPGIEIGKFLKQHGIHEACYLSPYHDSSWSKDRLEGLKESGIVVHAYVDEEFASPWDFKQIARKKVDKSSVEFYARNLEKQKLSALIQNAQFELGERFSEIPLVCVNDEVAGLCIEMAEGSSKKEPTYIGFDNSVESYLLRIPSYDFNTETLVEQMFYYISNPDAFTQKKNIHHIIGNVVEK